MRELPHYPMPVPAQVIWPLEATGDVKEHATKASLGQSEFHDIPSKRLNFFASSPQHFVFLILLTRVCRYLGALLTFATSPRISP